MWQTLWLWFVGHQSDLQNLLKDLLELRTQIATTVPNSEASSALQDRLTRTINRIEVAAVRADSLHGDLKGQVPLDPDNQEENDKLAENLERNRRETQTLASSDVGKIDPKAFESGGGVGTGSGSGSGSSSGEDFSVVQSLDIQGGVIVPGDEVESINGGIRSKVIAMRTKAGAIREVACKLADGGEQIYQAIELKKVV